MWNLGKPDFLPWKLGEPELLRAEPWIRTLGNLHLCKNFWEWNLCVEPSGTWTFLSGTLMWNLGNLNFQEWNLYAKPSGWFQVLGGCPKPPRSFIGRIPSLSSSWGKTETHWNPQFCSTPTLPSLRLEQSFLCQRKECRNHRSTILPALLRRWMIFRKNYTSVGPKQFLCRSKPWRPGKDFDRTYFMSSA